MLPRRRLRVGGGEGALEVSLGVEQGASEPIDLGGARRQQSLRGRNNPSKSLRLIGVFGGHALKLVE